MGFYYSARTAPKSISLKWPLYLFCFPFYFIIKNNLDYIFLTETWLNEQNREAILIETVLPNYNFINKARAPRKGGGVANLINNVYQCKQLSYGKFDSFRYVALPVVQY